MSQQRGVSQQVSVLTYYQQQSIGRFATVLL